MRQHPFVKALALMCALSVAALAAQDPAGRPEGETEKVTVKVPVKDYKGLSPAAVYQAAADGIRADVHFVDGFAGRASVPDAVRREIIEHRPYRVVLAFRTRSRLVCLVPSSAEDAIRVLFGLPRNWPVNAAVLERQLQVASGQKLSVDGTVVGTSIGERYVLVDAVALGEKRAMGGKREVLLLWPGQQEPRSMAEPGTKTFSFPCHYAADSMAQVKVTVRQLDRRDLMRELALRAAQIEVRPGQPAEARQYGEFAPSAVYRLTDVHDRVHVDFTDAFARSIRVRDDLSIVPGVRYGRVVRIPIGAAFRTKSQITCLVPAEWATPMVQAARTLGGEKVRIRGTVVGMLGAERCVVVDYLAFPDQEAVAPHSDVWLTVVEWPSPRPHTLRLWDHGDYYVRDLPCLHAPGRREALRIVLRQYRKVEIARPAAPQGAGTR